MDKIILDSDGLIKLNMAKILEKFICAFKCLIPKDVYEETVVKGKEELYPDAFELEEILKRGKVDIVEFIFSKEADSILREITGLGKGEIAVLNLFFENKDAVILSDDKRFLTFLERYEIPFITPGNALLYLVENGIMNVSEGLDKLERLKPYIRKFLYEKIKSVLLGEE